MGLSGSFALPAATLDGRHGDRPLHTRSTNTHAATVGYNSESCRAGCIAQPAVSNDGIRHQQRRIIMSRGQKPLFVGTNRFVAALDPRTGEELWRQAAAWLR